MSHDRAALVSASIEVIRAGQSSDGAYVAATSYPTYAFCWLRDGSFCAYAMDVVGEHASAAAFHAWVVRTLGAHAALLREAAGDARDRRPAAMPPTRFELDGEVESGEEGWPNFQLDGYGTWLWAFADHLRHTGRTATDQELAVVRLVSGYLVAAGDRPCYDCWEESVERRHTATVACSVAGLTAAARLLGDEPVARAGLALDRTLTDEFTSGGAFVKHDATDGVDASLLWLGVPFGVVEIDAPVFVATVDRVERELCVGRGGLRRYLGDTYYGGGEWILLTGWLGWVRCLQGDLDRARQLRGWIEAQATVEGRLPEQVTDNPQSPDHVEVWVDKWGSVATPLLWSHAMYLVLDRAIDDASRSDDV